MKTITIHANAEQAELMLHIIDQWYRHFYNVYGVRRIDSAKNGIVIKISELAWKYIQKGVLYEIVHRTGQSLSYYDEELYLPAKE